MKKVFKSRGEIKIENNLDVKEVAGIKKEIKQLREIKLEIGRGLPNTVTCVKTVTSHLLATPISVHYSQSL